MIGSLGQVLFEVSSDKILTFDGLNFSYKAKFAEHSIHNRNSLLEFTGFPAVTASMNILLNSALGVDPYEELENLKNIFREHEAVAFILDGEPQGNGLWVIENMGLNFNFLSNKGRAQIIGVNLSLKEYLDIDGQEFNQDLDQEAFLNDYNGIGNWG